MEETIQQLKLSNKLRQYFLDNREEKEKTSFWATDCEKSVWELFHKWKGTPETNPLTAEKLIEFGARKRVEESAIDLLKKAGIPLKELEGQDRIDFEWNGIRITGYCDGVLEDDTPLEIKTFYGDYQEEELKNMNPRTSYLKQLAVYMYAKQVNTGHLLYINFVLGTMYEFVLKRDGSKFKCELTDIEFDIEDEFRIWKRLYEQNIAKDIEPKLDILYKYPVEEMDWKSQSKSLISKARNNQKVIGDWQALYSPYLDLIIKTQGTVRGYTDKELELIKEATQGYTNW